MPYNKSWNSHYDFDAPENRVEILAVERYRIEEDAAYYTAGQVVESPWGTNRVVTAAYENGQDVCTKEIIVKPGYMLSLQRHRGREEFWEVNGGTLSAIADGIWHEIPSGGTIFLPKGCVHCMINSSDAPVTVLETQRGLCREGDNIRLLDSNGRPTYPLTSEVEFQSAILYARVQADLLERSGIGTSPHKAWNAFL